jgi:ABC-type sugar transport system permease subunit
MNDTSAPKKESQVILFAAIVVWASLFAFSIIAGVSEEPTGDGFTRGMNRTAVFVKWQAAAFVVSLMSFFMTRKKQDDLSATLRFVGKAPLYAHGAVLVFVVGAVVYAVLAK